ncbi:MAG: choice-of-anchor Q domain-containing protein [Actinomycetota bacterium]
MISRLMRALPIAALLLLPATPAAAAMIEVTTTADEFADPGPGTGCSLREAVRAANSDTAYGGCPAGDGSDTIVVGVGTYGLTLPGTLEDAAATGDLDILEDVTITGDGAVSTTIDGGGLEHVLHVDPNPGGDGPSLTLTGVTIRGGVAPMGEPNGGGIYVEYEGGLALDRVLITGNRARDTGGGLQANDDGLVTVTNSSISGNVSDNQAAGIGNWNDSVMTLSNSTVHGNIAESSGGGIINENSAALTIANSTISENVSTMGEGGGIHINNDGTLTITNSTISGNEAEEDGGGIFVNADEPTIALTNVTMAGNAADRDGSDDGDGGGISIEPPYLGTFTLKNTLIGDNTDATPGGGTVRHDCSAEVLGPVTSQGNNLIEDTTGCTIDGTTTGDVTGMDPRLGPLADNGGPTLTQALLPDSPAIDGADPAAAPPADQRGAPRNPDIGAYELVLCAGTIVNRIGAEGNDVLVGTGGPDGFLAGAGNDRVKALGGNDAACLGPGNDRAAGGGGKDILLGEQGKDRLRGQGGRDRLKGGPGKDRCSGGPGKDRASCEKERKVP